MLTLGNGTNLTKLPENSMNWIINIAVAFILICVLLGVSPDDLIDKAKNNGLKAVVQDIWYGESKDEE